MLHSMMFRIAVLLVVLCPPSSAAELLAGATQKTNKRILLKSLQACEHIKSGCYDIVYRHKFPFRKEVESITGHCTFSKLPSDKVLGARVVLVTPEKGEKDKTTYLHDGRYEVIVYPHKRRLVRVSNLQQYSPYYIAGSLPGGLLFEPLLPPILFPGDKKNSFKKAIKERAEYIHQLPDESVEGRPCGVFVVYCKDREEIKDEVLTLFVDHVLNVPIKYVHRATYWGSPTYEEAAISHFTLRYQEDPGCMPDARAKIPEGYEVIKDYEREYPKRTLLAVDTIAPQWTLPTVQGDELRLTALCGKVVLLSFWYRNFDPSLQYLQALQELHEKFQKQGLVVVGINAHEQREELTGFLRQRGIMYPNLIGNKKVEKDYQAYTPNTFYLLDQSGKVSYVTIAQGDFPKRVLHKKIKQLLNHNK